MSKLKEALIDKMIENALSYKQESRRLNINSLYSGLKGFVLRPNVYGLTFASLIIACVFIPPALTSRHIVDVNKINDYVTLSIIDDF